MRDMIKRGIDYAGSSSKATSGSVNKIPKFDLAEVNQFSLGQTSYQDKDPNKKLERMMDKRVYLPKHKLKKDQYVHELEKQARDLEAMNGLLRSQLEASEKEKHMLRIEKQVLVIQLIRQERERVVREGEVEKHKAEVDKQYELMMLRKQEKILRQRMQLAASSSNSSVQGFHTDPNGREETSRTIKKQNLQL